MNHRFQHFLGSALGGLDVSDELAADILTAFVDEVNERAEQKMLITGKLEGSHKAAMDELLKELGLK